MRNLYLIRHGQTDYNLRGIVQGGGIDASLNETGRRQGELFFEKYQEIKFDLLVASALVRTYQTIQPFERLGHAIKRIPELNEINWGILEGQTGNHLRALFDDMNGRWTSGDLDARMEGGESPREAWQRLKAGMDQVLKMMPEDGNALVCIHGRVMRIILSQMLGYGMQHMNLFPHRNTALNLLQIQGDHVTAVRLNDLSHIPQ
ncbi:MAG: histidine phosphatase family protein [Bacteroidota bacterium]